jgi:hypothetical protein
MAWALRGYENLLTDFVTDADTVESVLDIPFRYHLRAAERHNGLRYQWPQTQSFCQLIACEEEIYSRAMRDSNPRPLAPEGTLLPIWPVFRHSTPHFRPERKSNKPWLQKAIDTFIDSPLFASLMEVD